MDRKEKMDRITAMLKEGVENVFSSENYKVFLKTMSRFPRYSLNNQILLYQQTGGTATYVAGYKKWQTFGRNVSKGERGLLIIAPLPITKRLKSLNMFDADPKTRLTKDEIEVRAQSVAYAVLSYLNIAPEVEDRYSFGYIASFSSRDLSELKTVMQDVRDATEKIISAIAPQPVTQEISS